MLLGSEGGLGSMGEIGGVEEKVVSQVGFGRAKDRHDGSLGIFKFLDPASALGGFIYRLRSVEVSITRQLV